MSAKYYLLVLLIQTAAVLSALPPIQKCKLADSNCVKTSAQAALPVLAGGIPELGIEPLDVMSLDSINFDIAGLKLDTKDITIKGLKKSVISKLDVDMAKKQILLVFNCDVVFKSHYKASGMLLILPISGDGDMTLKLKHLEIQMTMPFEIKKNADGKDIIELKSHKYSYEVKEGTHSHLTNLFDGNKELSDAMLQFMNENWKALTVEFGGTMLKKPTSKIYHAIKTYLRSQPLEDIAEI